MSSTTAVRSVSETPDATYEMICYGGDGSDVGVVAPHAKIEPGTETQAVAVHEALSCPTWVCRVDRKSGASFQDVHITSSKITPRDFPSIQSTFQSKPRRCVSFHGMSKDGVKLGGLADRSVRNTLRDALRSELPSAVSVDCVEWGPYCGKSTRNIVNRLSQSGGVQIEQSRHVREAYGDVVAETVSRWLLERQATSSAINNTPAGRER